MSTSDGARSIRLNLEGEEVMVGMRPLVLLALVLVLVGCGSSSSLLLKPPLVMGCQRAGLPKCPELADGVIQYVDGDKEKAEQTIRGAVLGADHAKVKLLVEAIKTLPGGEEKFGDVIALIEGREPAAKSSSSSPSPATLAAAAPGGASSGEGSFAHLRASTVVVAGNPQARPCSAVSYSGAGPIPGVCFTALAGPAVVTDLDWSSGCPAETFALAGDPDQPIWFLRSEEGKPYAMHGGGLFIPAGTSLTVGHRLSSPDPLRPNASCAITWAARRP